MQINLGKEDPFILIKAIYNILINFDERIKEKILPQHLIECCQQQKQKKRFKIP